MQEKIDALFQQESRRVLATLIRLLGDFELAEEALQEAFTAAIMQWPNDGIPENPRAWLVSTGRFRAIDQLRKRSRFDESLQTQIYVYDEATVGPEQDLLDDKIEDDLLRLIFTCCHPSLSLEAQLALTLREVCNLTTEEIAKSFLLKSTAVAQRIVRAKAKIRDAGTKYEVPEKAQLNDRLSAVLHVIYLMFNEGYSASFGADLVRYDLTAEAIRIAELVNHLLPSPSVEAKGLLALMLLQDSRSEARVNFEGDIILLEDQDRQLWDRDKISRGVAFLNEAMNLGQVGPYTLQAAIAVEHARPFRSEDTNWHRIASLYSILLEIQVSPVIELNRAVAVAMDQGPSAGLDLIDDIFARGDLEHYHFAHAARADLLSKLKRFEEARKAYETALSLASQAAEIRFLEKRIADL